MGPLGWIAFLLVAPRRSGEELAVEVPYSEPAYERFVQGRRLRNGAMAGGAAVVIDLLFLTAWARLEEAGVLLVLAALVVATVTVLVGE